MYDMGNILHLWLAFYLAGLCLCDLLGGLM